MIFVLLRHLFVIDHEHITVDVRNMPVRSAENLKCAVDNLIGRNDVVVVTLDKMQIQPLLGLAPDQCSQMISDIIDFFFHNSYGRPVEVISKSGKIDIGRKNGLHRQHIVKRFLSMFMGGTFYFPTDKAFF